MEKLVYTLWKPDAVSEEEFGRSLLATARRFAADGARGVGVNLVDEHVHGARRARISALDAPLAGTISFWLDAADDRGPYERALAALAPRHAGYLVVESVPLRNSTHTAPLGTRTPGINIVTCIERPERLTSDEWLAHWLGEHKQVALETQCTYLYVRNVVVGALTHAAPAWGGIVEEGFPTDAVTEPRKWYKSEGSEERFRANLQRMMDSVNYFLDVARVESHPMSEYRISE
jgi:hypothetical protein